MWSVLLLVALMLQSSAVLAETAVCAETKDSSGMFSVVTRRNQTGHWLTEVSFSRVSDNQPAEEQKESGAWQFDLSFTRSRCGPAETLRTTAFVIVPPPRPRPGYEFHAGLGYYKFHPEGKTFAEAAATCEAEGAHLAIVNSEKESNILKEMYAKHPNVTNWAFVGFHDMFQEGQFVTIFGEPLSTTGFTRWVSSQPDNGGPQNPPEHCGSVHRYSGLNDYVCTWKAPFVCEQEL